ncbi:MAG: hypothetical protein II989_02535 [Bacteroidales bacterium]|nr:hypothetical protein [Bacteroidales bacterium]
MNKKNFNTVESYEAPAVNVIDIQVEGVLCASGDFDINDWEEDEGGLDF